MNRTELLDAVAKETGLSRATISHVLKVTFDIIGMELKKKDGRVVFTGYAIFEKFRRKGRTGRNPKTGEPVKIKTQNVIRIKAGEKLKKMVR